MKVMRKRFLAAALGMSLAVSMLPAAAFAEEESSEAETEAEEESSEEAEETFDYSAGFDENGFFEGIHALDYVTLLDYTNIELDYDIVVPTDDDVQSEIDSMISYYASTSQITDEDRLIVDGDTVNIDYVGSVDGVEFEGGSTEGAGTTVTIGVTSYIDGFLDQLIGHAPGENFDIEVTFPDPYPNNEDLSGKDAVFNITVNYIEEEYIPEFNDEFVAEYLVDYESAEEYRQSIYDSIYEENLFNALFEYVVVNSEISEIPESVVDTIYNERYDYFSTMASYYGMDAETYLSYYGMDLEAFRDMCESYAGDYLVLQAIMEDADWIIDLEAAQESLGFDDDTIADVVEYYGEPYVLFAASTDYTLGKLADYVTLVETEEESSEEAASEEEVSEEAETGEEESSSEAE